MTSLFRRRPKLAWFLVGVGTAVLSWGLFWLFSDRSYDAIGGVRLILLLLPLGLAIALAGARLMVGSIVRIMPYLLGVLATPPVIVAGLLIVEGVAEPGPRPFDSKAWKRPVERGDADTMRFWMVDDLLRRDLRGLARAEVAFLLGEPDRQGADASGPVLDWIIRIGWDEASPFDGDILRMNLDSNGKVASVARRR